jgi:5-formyltetrahydrofolate cyclo-ligase
VRISKQSARAQARTAIAAIGVDERAQYAQMIARQVTALREFEAAEFVLAYVALPDEVSTQPILELFAKTEKVLVLPRVLSRNGELEIARVADPNRDLVPGEFGIAEPAHHCEAVAAAEVDLALLPGRAFDRTGARVGRGRGFYDRFLPLLRPGAPRIALAFHCQLFDTGVEIGDHDIHVDKIVTEREVIER